MSGKANFILQQSDGQPQSAFAHWMRASRIHSPTKPTWRAPPPSLSTPCPWSHVRTSANLKDGFHLNQMFNSLNDFLNEGGLHCMDLMLAYCHIH